MISGEIQVRRIARPAIPVVIGSPVLVLDVELLRLRLGVDVVVPRALDVRVNNRDHPPPLGPQLLLHRLRIRKEMLVPRQVPLPVSVLNVEPKDVVGIVELLELSVHGRKVPLVLVVPPALVVPQAEQRWEGNFPND